MKCISLLFPLTIAIVLSAEICAYSYFPLSSKDSKTLVYTPLDKDDTEISYPKSYLKAINYMLLSNLALLTFNRYALRADYAYVSEKSIKRNVTSPWVWDQDEFSVNHLGHPYQGSTYYIAGRSNGLSFLQSSVLTSSGSIFWELFCENETPSYNDFIVTTLGGIATGEMLHRLYVEIDPINSFFSGVVSPIDSFNQFFCAYEPPVTYNKNISELAVSAGTGSVLSTIEFDDLQREEITNEFPITFACGIDVIYGKPYGQRTKTPFNHFQFSSNINWQNDYFMFLFFSDAYLFSFSPFSHGAFRTTIGPSLHYDVIYTNEVQYSGNSLGITCKQQIELPLRNVIRWAAHLNWLVLGATDYHYFVSNEISKPESGQERRDYDLGTGTNVKLSLAYSQPKLGTFALSYIFNGMHTIPSSVPEQGSEGYSIIGLWNVTYEHRLWRNYWIGISNSLYHKNGYYKNAVNVSHYGDYGYLYLKIRI